MVLKLRWSFKIRWLFIRLPTNLAANNIVHYPWGWHTTVHVSISLKSFTISWMLSGEHLPPARRFACVMSYTPADHSLGHSSSSCILAWLTNKGFQEALCETYWRWAVSWVIWHHWWWWGGSTTNASQEVHWGGWPSGMYFHVFEVSCPHECYHRGASAQGVKVLIRVVSHTVQRGKPTVCLVVMSRWYWGPSLDLANVQEGWGIFLDGWWDGPFARSPWLE